MDFSRRRLRYWSRLFPITLNAVFFTVAAWLVWYWLLRGMPDANTSARNADGTSTFRPFIYLLGRISFWFVLALTALSLFTTLFAWLRYWYLHRKGKAPLQITFPAEARKKGRMPKLWIEAVAAKVWRPLLGLVAARLVYDDGQMTPKFALLGNVRKPGKLLSWGIRARSRLRLPDVKEYELRGAVVYFEDMLRLLSLPVVSARGGQFYQPPQMLQKPEHDLSPKKTESPDVRIEEMRRVEGELTNYKAFEPGDDVRRIVWKVYARSRDLVVRHPELFEPYASHLYFYASFYASLSGAVGGNVYFQEALNYYKHRVYTIYEALADKEFQLRYQPDQPVKISGEMGPAERHQRMIAASAWQRHTPLEGYFQSRAAAVLCISSLMEPEDLARVLNEANPGLVLYYVRLSETFRHFAPLGWLGRLIFLPPKDRLARVRGRWLLSGTRLRLRRNEAALEKVLDAWGGTVGRV